MRIYDIIHTKVRFDRKQTTHINKNYEQDKGTAIIVLSQLKVLIVACFCSQHALALKKL